MRVDIWEIEILGVEILVVVVMGVDILGPTRVPNVVKWLTLSTPQVESFSNVVFLCAAG